MPPSLCPSHALRSAVRAAARRQRGFTLVELMIALAVLALLAGMAYPAYNEHVARSRRADAKQSLVELAQKLERFYTERGTYVGASLGGSGLYPGSSRGGYYSLAITAQTADGFTITATPTGAQASDACATFTYNQLGEQGVGPAASLSAAKCW